MKKIPSDAFDYYFSMGPGRSYQAVAEKYSVTKRAVTNLAKRESWQRRVAEVEQKAREKADQEKVETLEAIRTRHLKALRLLQARAIEALTRKPIETAMDGARALGLSIREERVTIGEPSDRTEVSIDEKIRKEYQRWMVVKEDDDDEGHADAVG